MSLKPNRVQPTCAFCLWVFVGVLMNSPSLSQEQPLVAVFDIEDADSEFPPKVIARLSDLMTVLVAKSGYQVIPHAQIRARLQESKKVSYKSCYDEICQVEVGKELSAQKRLASKLVKRGGTCTITADLHDLYSKKVEKTASITTGCREIALAMAVERVTDDLAVKKPNPPAPPGKTGDPSAEAMRPGDDK